MRYLASLILLLALLSSSISAAAVDKQKNLGKVEDALSEPKASDHPIPDGPKAGATNSEAVSSTNTKFNGMEVPPMRELTGDGFEKEVKDGYWFVKHFSPYCHHCKDIAPAWQTLYEFYYTSKPVPGKTSDKDSMNSFARYYDFNFASLDCVAYGDACAKNDVNAFPTFSLYKDGKLLKKDESVHNMENLSKFVEENLESIRPGSRAKDGLKLPAPGASSVNSGTEDSKKDAVGDKDADKKESTKSEAQIEKILKEGEKTDSKDSDKVALKRLPSDKEASAGSESSKIEKEKAETKASADSDAEKKSASTQEITKDKESEKAMKKQPADKETVPLIAPIGKVGSKKQSAEQEKFDKDAIKVADVSTATETDASSPTEAASSPQTVKTLPKKKKKPSGPPNQRGDSVSLTAESFQKLVTYTADPWFVKFYAPWCHHCQALAPSWLQMAKELQNKLNIGEVNCDEQPRLCKDVRVQSYPTIHFFRGGERVEYDGLRGLGDLVSFAKKALDVGGGVPFVDLEQFKTMEETDEVIFVYFFDHATSSEDFDALELLTLSLVGHAKLVKTNDTAMFERFKISTWPRFAVSRSGRANYYEALAPKDMRDFRQVLTWMQKVWLPIVPELTASNARDIMKNKYVVLGILNREKADDFALDKREMKNAALEWMEKQTHAFQLERQELRDAKQLRLEEAEDRDDKRAKQAAKQIHIDIREDDKKQVSFAWVDGVFWERWIRTAYGINVHEGEKVIILDEDVSSALDYRQR